MSEIKITHETIPCSGGKLLAFLLGLTTFPALMVFMAVLGIVTLNIDDKISFCTPPTATGRTAQ